ncbi:hypothetical protein [Arthrobacter psychrochitiniphilus]|uniref:hypothetical protein n=1 Tax=Arthrobacter psychrochitiniphilus TaxID=291045 RepID=UPI003F7B491D
MNSAQRRLNRTVLALLGLMFLGLASIAVLTGTTGPGALQTTTAELWARIQENLAAAPIPGTNTSWWSLAALALLVLLAVLLVWWIIAQGRGRSSYVARQASGAGDTAVDTAVAGQLIKDALANNTAALSCSVTSWRARGVVGGVALKIRVQARRGASPADLTAEVEHLVRGLDALLGSQIPVLVHIRAGTRTKFGRAGRVL